MVCHWQTICLSSMAEMLHSYLQTKKKAHVVYSIFCRPSPLLCRSHDAHLIFLRIHNYYQSNSCKMVQFFSIKRWHCVWGSHQEFSYLVQSSDSNVYKWATVVYLWYNLWTYSVLLMHSCPATSTIRYCSFLQPSEMSTLLVTLVQTLQKLTLLLVLKTPQDNFNTVINY